MNLSKFVEYVKVHAVWKNKPDKSTPVNADALMTIESGIKSNNEAISELAAAVVSEIANDPNKIANMAALYAVQQAAFPKANLVNQIVNDATKAASAAALYSVNETLKQTNSNFLNRNIKTYTSLEQLGITSSTAAVKQIAKAMPDNSIFISTEALIADKPQKTWGNIEITRVYEGRWSAKWYSQTASNNEYYEYGMAGTGDAASEWKTLYSGK